MCDFMLDNSPLDKLMCDFMLDNNIMDKDSFDDYRKEL